MALRQWGGRHHDAAARGGRRDDDRRRHRGEWWSRRRGRLARRRAERASGPPLRRGLVGLMDADEPLVVGEVEQVTDALCYPGEGPVWSPSGGGLRWADMLAGDVLTLRAVRSVERVHVGDVAEFLRPRTRGGWVVATERGLSRAEGADGIPEPWFDLWDDPSIRMNEGGVDAEGRLWAGTMGYDRVPGTATLYRVDAGGAVDVVVPDATISNGVDL